MDYRMRAAILRLLRISACADISLPSATEHARRRYYAFLLPLCRYYRFPALMMMRRRSPISDRRDYDCLAMRPARFLTLIAAGSASSLSLLGCGWPRDDFPTVCRSAWLTPTKSPANDAELMIAASLSIYGELFPERRARALMIRGYRDFMRTE